MFSKGLGGLFLALVLILPSSFLLAGSGGQSSFFVGAEDVIEDVAEGEDDTDATIDSDSPDDDGGLPNEGATTTEGESTDESTTEEEQVTLKASPDAETTILFTRPTSRSEFPAGGPVSFLVGFSNKGSKTFNVESLDASFRYPQDYSFYIQNFTTAYYSQEVGAKMQATFEYGFVPSETFNARPFGLTINLNYKDSEGNLFQDAVFNETVQITDADEGLDGETFFLYVLLAALAVLLLVGAQQLVSTFGRKHLGKPKQTVEMGTQNNTDVDYDWIPKETLEMNNKSPKRSPRQSPRQRKTKRSTGADD